MSYKKRVKEGRWSQALSIDYSVEKSVRQKLTLMLMISFPWRMGTQYYKKRIPAPMFSPLI